MKGSLSSKKEGESFDSIQSLRAYLLKSALDIWLRADPAKDTFIKIGTVYYIHVSEVLRVSALHI